MFPQECSFLVEGYHMSFGVSAWSWQHQLREAALRKDSPGAYVCWAAFDLEHPRPPTWAPGDPQTRANVGFLL